jgi:hypothetical protein
MKNTINQATLLLFVGACLSSLLCPTTCTRAATVPLDVPQLEEPREAPKPRVRRRPKPKPATVRSSEADNEEVITAKDAEQQSNSPPQPAETKKPSGIQPQPNPPSYRVEQQSNPPAQPAETKKSSGIQPQPSPLSYGMVTSRVKKGITTQSDLIRLFGGPNITTMDADGTETWVYDKTANESEVMDTFFSLGYYGAKHSRNANSIRNITVIIKFNKNKTVKDFSARAAIF